MLHQKYVLVKHSPENVFDQVKVKWSVILAQESYKTSILEFFVAWSEQYAVLHNFLFEFSWTLSRRVDTSMCEFGNSKMLNTSQNSSQRYAKYNNLQMANLQRVSSLLLYLVLTLICTYLTVEVSFLITNNFNVKLNSFVFSSSIYQDVFRFLERETSTKVFHYHSFLYYSTTKVRYILNILWEKWDKLKV